MNTNQPYSVILDGDPDYADLKSIEEFNAPNLVTAYPMDDGRIELRSEHPIHLPDPAQVAAMQARRQQPNRRRHLL